MYLLVELTVLQRSPVVAPISLSVSIYSVNDVYSYISGSTRTNRLWHQRWYGTWRHTAELDHTSCFNQTVSFRDDEFIFVWKSFSAIKLTYNTIEYLELNSTSKHQHEYSLYFVMSLNVWVFTFNYFRHVIRVCMVVWPQYISVCYTMEMGTKHFNSLVLSCEWFRSFCCWSKFFTLEDQVYYFQLYFR